MDSTSPPSHKPLGQPYTTPSTVIINGDSNRSQTELAQEFKAITIPESSYDQILSFGQNVIHAIYKGDIRSDIHNIILQHVDFKFPPNLETNTIISLGKLVIGEGCKFSQAGVLAITGNSRGWLMCKPMVEGAIVIEQRVDCAVIHAFKQASQQITLGDLQNITSGELPLASFLEPSSDQSKPLPGSPSNSLQTPDTPSKRRALQRGHAVWQSASSKGASSPTTISKHSGSTSDRLPVESTATFSKGSSTKPKTPLTTESHDLPSKRNLRSPIKSGMTASHLSEISSPASITTSTTSTTSTSSQPIVIKKKMTGEKTAKLISQLKQLMPDFNYSEQQSIVINIVTAIRANKFPSHRQVTFQGIHFRCDSHLILPSFVQLDDCVLEEGPISFSSGTLTIRGNDAFGIANTPHAVITIEKGVGATNAGGTIIVIAHSAFVANTSMVMNIIKAVLATQSESFKQIIFQGMHFCCESHLKLPSFVQLDHCVLAEGLLSFRLGTLTICGKAALGFANTPGATMSVEKGIGVANKEGAAITVTGHNGLGIANMRYSTVIVRTKDGQGIAYRRNSKVIVEADGGMGAAYAGYSTILLNAQYACGYGMAANSKVVAGVDNTIMVQGHEQASCISSASNTTLLSKEAGQHVTNWITAEQRLWLEEAYKENGGVDDATQDRNMVKFSQIGLAWQTDLGQHVNSVIQKRLLTDSQGVQQSSPKAATSSSATATTSLATPAKKNTEVSIIVTTDDSVKAVQPKFDALAFQSFLDGEVSTTDQTISDEELTSVSSASSRAARPRATNIGPRSIGLARQASNHQTDSTSMDRSTQSSGDAKSEASSNEV